MVKKTLTHILLSALITIATGAVATGARAQSSPPFKLAVFDIELDDFTAGGPIAGESPEETARLQRMTALARELLSSIRAVRHRRRKRGDGSEGQGPLAAQVQRLRRRHRAHAWRRPVLRLLLSKSQRDGAISRNAHSRRAHGRTGAYLADGSARGNRPVMDPCAEVPDEISSCRAGTRASKSSASAVTAARAYPEVMVNRLSTTAPESPNSTPIPAVRLRRYYIDGVSCDPARFSAG